MATIELEDAFADDSLEMDEVGDKFRVAADLQARIVATGPITSAPPSQITVTPAATGAATETARADHVHDVAVATPTALSVGGSNAAGTSVALARADHKHALPAFGSPAAEAIGSAAADGVATTFARADHVHAMPAAAAAVALTPGGANAAGSAATLARSDHVHALPAFPLLTNSAPTYVARQTASAGVAADAARSDHLHDIQTGGPTALVPGNAGAQGTAFSLSRADHVHGLPAFGSAAGTFCEGSDTRLTNFGPPAALAIGSSALIGTAGAFARHDHVHPMPGGGVPVAIAVDGANAAGSAATFARSDHVHLLNVAFPTDLVVGGANVVGSAVNVTRADHKHGLPPFGSAAGTFCEGNDARLSAALVNPAVNGFRLAPTADDSIPADGTFSTIYLAPVESDLIALYTAGAWALRSASGLSYTLAARTTDRPFDLFAWWDTSGTPAVKLEAVDWSATPNTRATPLVKQNGAWTKSGDPTRRYLGTVRPRSATTYRVQRIRSSFEAGSAGIDYWNVANRQSASLFLGGVTGSMYAYTTTVYRQANANPNAQIEALAGLPGLDAAHVTLLGGFNTANVAFVYPSVAIGVDSTTVPASQRGAGCISAGGGDTGFLTAELRTSSPLGVTRYVWLEYGEAGTNFFGASAGTRHLPGLSACVWY